MTATLKPIPSGLTPAAIARAQVGQAEVGGPNLGPIVRWSIESWDGGGWPEDPDRRRWCAGFVSTCYLHAGYDFRRIGSLSCDKLYERCQTFLVDSPQTDDIVFFHHDGVAGVAHVGIVDLANETAVQTIEGNKGDAVRRASYLRTDPRIMGYARPPRKAGA